ncbi:hypothetical protein NOR_04218 [Metarhizium rileyi]|uniref:Uncharacterized protein n=1 Tax=Metarhizium rileyi (strain RCEF 4871) TaxID=1649241 RepID=A0A162JL70_METRR|nr:hypothetical protein NOR_04218 [Metarhizium rileyi RCEF 4871]
MPQQSRGRDCISFEATDASTIEPVTFRVSNPTMDWWFRVREDIDPEKSSKLLGRIVIGQLPHGVSIAELRGLLERVPLPVKNTHPQQSCVTWAMDVIRTLQGEGWVWDFELDPFKDSALSYADERLKGSTSREQKVKYYKS